MSTTPKPRRRLSEKARTRIKRALLGIAVALPLTVVATWYAANNVPWFGAWLADTLRSVIGTEAVGDLEEWAYGVEDRWNQFWRAGEKPKTYWDAPSSSASGSAPAPTTEPGASATPTATGSAAAAPPSTATFRPKDVGPMLNPKYAAPGDGVWVEVQVPDALAGPPTLYKTLIHPDSKRPWAEVFVVAIDVSRTALHAVAGTQEPRGTAPGAREAKRPGLIPETDVPALVAGFNGGFKEEHGHYGMKIDGVLLIKPRADACTIGKNAQGVIRIGPWKVLGPEEGTFTWWRQTPACLVHQGKLHPALYDENTNWGAALGGGTVVRRSALGLSADGATMFVAVSNHTSPRTIATAMAHAGAADVAQLDINYSYPRFVLFPKNESGQRESASLFEGFKVDKDDYLREKSIRDFFYVTRKDP